MVAVMQATGGNVAAENLAATSAAAAAPGAAVTMEGATRLSLGIGRIAAGDWRLEGLAIELVLGDEGIGLRGRVETVLLPPPVGELSDLRLDCPRIELAAGNVACADAALALESARFGAQRVGGDFAYDRAAGILELGLDGVETPGGRADLALRISSGGARLDIDAAALDLAALAAVPEAEALGAYAPSGELDVTARIELAEDGALAFDTRLAARSVSFGNEAGTVAGEGLTLTAQLHGRRAAEASAPWKAVLALGIESGEAYVEPVYAAFGGNPLTLDAELELLPAGELLTVRRLVYRHRGHLAAAANGRLAYGHEVVLQALDLSLEKLYLPNAYEGYLRGFLVGTPLGKLETAGSFGGRLVSDADGVERLQIRVESLSVDDRDRRFALYGLDGEVDWRDTHSGTRPASVEPSALTWHGGFLFAAGFGAGELRFVTEGNAAELLAPLRLPLLDGALLVSRLSLEGIGSGAPDFDFEAELEPIGLRRLTAAIGWPSFAGSLSGRLPLLRYRDGVMTLGGRLQARVFDGTVAVTDLRVTDPFGALPRTRASLEMESLDLEEVTSAFSFGNVTGRLDGYVRGLEILKQHVTAFDARFYTPEGTDAPRRISRRALDDLSEIAGGAPRILTSGFLSLFETFPYETIGISLRLENDFCYISGIEPTEDGEGFYLVRGRWLPRINVIGHTREVNWPQFVSQVDRALAAAGPSIQSESE